MPRHWCASLALIVLVAACGGGAAEVTTAATDASATTVVATSAVGGGASTTSVPVAAEERVPLAGFTLSPLSSGADDFNEFLRLVGEGGTLLEWVGDGYEWASGGTPDTVAALADSIGVEAITIGGWARTEDGSLLRPLNDSAVAEYVDAATSFAASHRPAYMGFGVEVDTEWRQFPADWDAATRLFEATATAIHAASPETLVFVVFQLERLRGLQGGLFGGDDDAAGSWDLIDDFPSADLIGFTTYPGLVFETPADIPEDYYTSILDHVKRPIGFSEVGWQAGGDLGTYSGTPQRQAEFVTRFPRLIEGLDVAFVTWSFLFDQPIGPPFGTMGLFDTGGEPRLGWGAWLEAW